MDGLGYGHNGFENIAASSSGNEIGDHDRETVQSGEVFDLTSLPDYSKNDAAELEYLIDNIEMYFLNQLKTHQDDFKNAYKGQMQKVKKELQFLKQKRNDANGALMNDSRITSLQTWIAWFKNEALLLDSILEKQKREVSK